MCEEFPLLNMDNVTLVKSAWDHLGGLYHLEYF